MEHTILHCCGHQQVRFVPGFFAGDREHEAARMARRRCDSCREAERRSAAPVPADDGTMLVADVRCRALRGSPKQVAWAETIRAKRLAALVRAGGDGADRLAAVDEARWWIDHRAEPVEQLLTRC